MKRVLESNIKKSESPEQLWGKNSACPRDKGVITHRTDIRKKISKGSVNPLIKPLKDPNLP